MERKYILFVFSAVFLLAACKHKEQPNEDRHYLSIDSIPMLILQIQKCSRLYTTELQVHKIITHEDDVRVKGKILGADYDLPLPLGDRKIAIPMDATLKAYIDFGNFSEDNIAADGQKLTVRLPNPHVMLTSTKIDQEGIKEYVSLARAHFSDKELTVYEQQGREAIIESIPRLGIVELARQSAARVLIPLLVQMGYKEEDITIEFSDDFKADDIRNLLDTNIEKQ